MIAKKNPKADLEKKRFVFFQIGLILSGSFCLAAFEYSTVNDENEKFKYQETAAQFFPEDPIGTITIAQPKQAPIPKIVDDVLVVDKDVIEVSEQIEKPEEILEIGDGESEEEIFLGDYVLEKEEFVTIPDVDPKFPGGLGEMAKFIQEHIELPDFIPDYDQGTIYVSFNVTGNGTIDHVKIERGLSPELNKAALAVVKAMPNWIGAEKNGKKVATNYTLPIKIALRN